jgi:hypothetical protein
MVGFYARFIPGYGDVANIIHGLKKKVCRLSARKLNRELLKISSLLFARHRSCRRRIFPGNLCWLPMPVMSLCQRSSNKEWAVC